MKGTVDAD